MGRQLVHIEFAHDTNFALAHWYGKMLGWNIMELPEMFYATGAWSEERGLGAGFIQMANDWPAGAIIPYFLSEDIEADIAHFKANGAEHVGEVMHVPTVGSMAYFKDPGGNVIALLQAEEGAM